MPATPQDHKQKDEGVSFTVAGKRYRLPKVNEKAATSIPGSITMDAVMEPDNDAAQLRLAFATLTACEPSPEVMAAFRSLPTKEMIELVGRWLGESSGSSA